ncbi:hypothetical protein LZL87_008819 [Fusarium oxysporum]|nr:hypothetical protein LZL87_008819 [Fusarium oxysporum]
MRVSLGRSHGLLAGFVIATRFADAAGIVMFPQGYLADRGLPSTCEATLYQSVNCPEEAGDLMSYGYLDSDDPAVTKLVCRQVCGSSIGHMRTKVASACGSEELIPGMPYSCFTDPKTGDNCKDVIAAFPKVDSLSKLPKSDICSYCNVEQYAMMQADSYTGVYDEYVKASYEYVAKACDLDVENFNATDSAFNITIPDTKSDICVSGNTYTTKYGNSCDSIALAQGVSAATMYYINPNIFDCSKITAGTELCLPLTCTKIYKVKQGGTYSGQPLNSTEPFDPQPIDPPKGAPVANGTTKECSHWITHDGSLSCTQICLAYEIPINLFTAANPSLNKTTCDTDLVVGNAYCLKPVDGWYQSDATETVSPTVTATKSATSTNSITSINTATHTSTGEKVPSPTQPGIVDGCNKWHYVDNGDGCYSIAEKYYVQLADFYSWNSKVSNDCSGLWLHNYVCVGVAS